MLSLATAVFIQENQHWFGDHPYVRYALYGIALLLAALTTIQFIWQQGHDHAAKSADLPLSISVAPVISPVFNNSPTVNVESTATSKEVKASPLPKLKIDGVSGGTVRFNDQFGRWESAPDGPSALFVLVSNPLPDKGRSGMGARSIAAHVEFFCVGERFHVQIDRAYWVGYSANRVDLAVGEQKKIFIGFLDDAWITFANPRARSFSPSLPQLRSTWGACHLGEEKRIPIASQIQFIVTLIAAASEATIEKGNFVIDVRDGQYTGSRIL